MARAGTTSRAQARLLGFRKPDQATVSPTATAPATKAITAPRESEAMIAAPSTAVESKAAPANASNLNDNSAIKLERGRERSSPRTGSLKHKQSSATDAAKESSRNSAPLLRLRNGPSDETYVSVKNRLRPRTRSVSPKPATIDPFRATTVRIHFDRGCEEKVTWARSITADARANWATEILVSAGAIEIREITDQASQRTWTTTQVMLSRDPPSWAALTISSAAA